MDFTTKAGMRAIDKEFHAKLVPRMRLGGSVGRGGKNTTADIAIVSWLLALYFWGDQHIANLPGVSRTIADEMIDSIIKKPSIITENHYKLINMLQKNLRFEQTGLLENASREYLELVTNAIPIISLVGYYDCNGIWSLFSPYNPNAHRNQIIGFAMVFAVVYGGWMFLARPLAVAAIETVASSPMYTAAAESAAGYMGVNGTGIVDKAKSLILGAKFFQDLKWDKSAFVSIFTSGTAASFGGALYNSIYAGDSCRENLRQSLDNFKFDRDYIEAKIKEKQENEEALKRQEKKYDELQKKQEADKKEIMEIIKKSQEKHISSLSSQMEHHTMAFAQYRKQIHLALRA